MDTASSLSSQAVSIIVSLTGGLSFIVAVQLTKRFPLSFHSSTPRWKYPVVAFIGYLVVYIGLIAYGVTQAGRFSSTLALMAAPSVPLHAFLWALIPQTSSPPDAPSTNNYVLQVLRRKSPLGLLISCIPLVGAAVAAGIVRDWQGLAVQIITVTTFLAVATTPEKPLLANKDAFGRAGRFLLLPRPGRRNDTVAYCVDLREETMLEPVRMAVDGVENYRVVSEMKFGRLGRETDDATTSEVPIATYLDSIVSRFPLDRIGRMTSQLWRTLEAWKERVEIPAKELPLMYGLVERMTYVAFRPGSCTEEERAMATRLNFINCRADCERGPDSPQYEPAVARRNEWRQAGEELVRAESWTEAAARANNVDVPLISSATLLTQLEEGNNDARDTVETLGSMVMFIRFVFGHTQHLVDTMVRNLPMYHQRIRNDLIVQGSIPVVCHGVMFSMKKRGFITEDVYSHSWASSGAALRWGGGGYALLDQAYARNSAAAYVVQLVLIAVKNVLEK